MTFVVCSLAVTLALAGAGLIVVARSAARAGKRWRALRNRVSALPVATAAADAARIAATLERASALEPRLRALRLLRFRL